MEANRNSYREQIGRAISRRVITAGLVGLLLMLTVWIVQSALLGIPLTPGGIWQLHQQNAALWLVGLLPLVLAYAIYALERKHSEKVAFLEDEIRQGKEDIRKNALFAKQIGEGQYNASFQVSDEDDILGKSLLAMRENLLANQEREAELSWISKGKEEISHILRLHNNIEELSYEVLIKLIKYIDILQGALYLYDQERETLTNLATYAYNRKRYLKQEFRVGQGLIGQCAYERDFIYRTEIPDDYATITSGLLGDQKPQSLLIVPLITDEKLQGVLEFASIEGQIPELKVRFLQEMSEIIGQTLFNLRINLQTERLLREAQQMTQELKENEEELRQNAEEMRATHEELERSNAKLECQIQEVENAQKRLHSLLENASEIISIYSSSLKLTYISPSVTKILGYTPQEMMSGKDMDRLTRRGEQDINQLFEALLDQPQHPITIQYTFMKKDGEKIFLEVTGRNLLTDPAINGIILNSQDITERKRAEKEERMRSKMQALSENSPDMIMRLNTAGQFFYCNPMVEKYTGIAPRDLINQTFCSVPLHEVLVEFFREALRVIKVQKANIESDVTFAAPGGQTVIMHITAIPEFSDNELETILFVSHDITEAKRIEQEIKDKNRKITESINYAQRIQTSILPSNRIIRQYLPKSFIYYKPRDVVSGDFPWFFVKDDNVYIAAVDCTGHGVPGALLSFIAYFLLNNVVDHDSSYTAARILDLLHHQVRKTLKQDRPDTDARDGMDIALCKISARTRELHFAGAHRPLYLLRDGELIEFKGERKAIGGIPHLKKEEKEFANHLISITPGDRVFFFSDGLPDQIGGPENRKYSPQRVRELILANPDASMPQLNEIFEKDFEEYMGDNKQIDDVLVIGIEF